MYIYIHIYMVAPTYLYIYIHTYIHTYIYIERDACTPIHPPIHSSIRPHIQACMHPCINTYMPTFIHHVYLHVRRYASTQPLPFPVHESKKRNTPTPPGLEAFDGSKKDPASKRQQRVLQDPSSIRGAPNHKPQRLPCITAYPRTSESTPAVRHLDLRT